MVGVINRPGMFGTGYTLYLDIAPGGSKQWTQRVTINGKRHDSGLGGCRFATLAQARDPAYENRMLARRGGRAGTAAHIVAVRTFQPPDRRFAPKPCRSDPGNPYHVDRGPRAFALSSQGFSAAMIGLTHSEHPVSLRKSGSGNRTMRRIFSAGNRTTMRPS